MIRTLALLTIFMSILGGMTGNNSAEPESSVTSIQQVAALNGVLVDLVLLERTPTRLKFQVQITNTRAIAVLVVSNPVRVDGSKGAYLSLNQNNADRLEIHFTVFPPPIYTIYAPKNRVTFLRLNSGATHIEQVVLDNPFNDTKPPWGEWQDTKPLDIRKIQHVVANVGILPDDPAIHAALSNVPSPDGLEVVESGPLKGKPLFEVQTIVSSKIIKL
jgi:hypothetical protein